MKKGKGNSSASAASEASQQATSCRSGFRFCFLGKGKVDHVAPVEGDAALTASVEEILL